MEIRIEDIVRVPDTPPRLSVDDLSCNTRRVQIRHRAEEGRNWIILREIGKDGPLESCSFGLLWRKREMIFVLGGTRESKDDEVKETGRLR